ncbi:lipid A disaccharide synthase [Geotalea daltonii FRC-32]|uniref:Lipid-A-disaccharide synthase n=2 Tax=Geotalea TaxID=2910589 RepID=B9M8W1_GEODF|nr:lipid A disaccharide synthase [Geotalea daltonii FRC-32]
MVQGARKIMISAGEASGDMYGAVLAREISALDFKTAFIGMGGPGMRAAGVETVVDANEMAVVGLVEVIAHFPVIVKAFNTLKNILHSDPPDLLILIDYPDFNLRLAKVAKKAGVKVLYFISPQVWAWRAGRVKKIGRVIDQMAVLFPFEVPYYEREQVPVTFVGHPLLDMVRPTMTKAEATTKFGLADGRRVIGLFPGSRRGEIKSLFPVILQSARLLKDRHPDIEFVLPLASSLKREELQPSLDASGLEIKVVENATHDVIQVCDAIITVSGTVTMEIAILGVPMVIIYKVSPFTYAVGKRLIKVDHIGICNIVAGERAVKELIQHDAEPEKIAAEITAILEDTEYAIKIRKSLAAVPAKLGSGGALHRVAQLALSLMRENEKT